jgi:hypothetical protein
MGRCSHLSTGPCWLGESHLPAKKNFDGFLLLCCILNLKAFCFVCLTACVDLPDLIPSGPR